MALSFPLLFSSTPSLSVLVSSPPSPTLASHPIYQQILLTLPKYIPHPTTVHRLTTSLLLKPLFSLTCIIAVVSLLPHCLCPTVTYSYHSLHFIFLTLIQILCPSEALQGLMITFRVKYKLLNLTSSGLPEGLSDHMEYHSLVHFCVVRGTFVARLTAHMLAIPFLEHSLLHLCVLHLSFHSCLFKNLTFFPLDHENSNTHTHTLP